MFVGDTPKHEDAVGQEVRSLITHAKTVSAAVAYIRSCPASLLGLSAKQLSDLVLVCDPYGGGCNPNVLDQCRAGGASVRFLKGLHAKVFITETALITGSANLSQIALGSGNWEAVSISTDGSDIASAHDWFSHVLQASTSMDTVRANPLLWGQVVAAWKQNIAAPKAHRVDIAVALLDPYHHAVDTLSFSLASD